ncbi:hypothetical protein MSIBF_A1200004 [groundwater metagenome]|uniref:Uncharacterized protein n=1 Tax=groundwater metagenome TaxID=717931 RepID=A0A098E5X0_9ZZZZ
MLIYEYRRIQQAIDKNRAKVENNMRKNALLSIRKNLNEISTKSSLNTEIIHKLANPLLSEKTQAKIFLLRKHSESYRLILQVLDDLTNGMTDGVTFHNINAYSGRNEIIP